MKDGTYNEMLTFPDARILSFIAKRGIPFIQNLGADVVLKLGTQ